MLKLTMLDRDLRRVRGVAFTRKSDSFDEGEVAEGVAAWIMDPLPEGAIPARR